MAGVRTPFGRYGGALGHRPPGRPGRPRAPRTQPPAAVGGLGRSWTTSLIGCANQAGEDNRNVARMATLLAGLPVSVPGGTVNRLCGSSLDAIAIASRAVRSGDADLVLAGGVESMSRAPFVIRQGDVGVLPAGRDPRHHHRLAVRQPGDAGAVRHRLDAGDRRERGRGVRRSPASDQDAFALRSQERAAKAIAIGPAGQGDRAGAGPAAAGRPGASSTPTSTRGRPRWRRWPSCSRSARAAP